MLKFPLVRCGQEGGVEAERQAEGQHRPGCLTHAAPVQEEQSGGPVLLDQRAQQDAVVLGDRGGGGHEQRLPADPARLRRHL